MPIKDFIVSRRTLKKPLVLLDTDEWGRNLRTCASASASNASKRDSSSQLVVAVRDVMLVPAE